MTQDDDDRRASPRKRVDLEAEIEIVLPEKTFTAERYGATISNLNASGARLHADVPRRDYVRIAGSATFRLVRIHATLPGQDSRVRLMGMVVGFDYDRSAEPPLLNISVKFGENEKSDRDALAEYARSIASEE